MQTKTVNKASHLFNTFPKLLVLYFLTVAVLFPAIKTIKGNHSFCNIAFWLFLTWLRRNTLIKPNNIHCVSRLCSYLWEESYTSKPEQPARWQWLQAWSRQTTSCLALGKKTEEEEVRIGYVALLPPSGEQRYCRAAFLLSNYSPSTVRMKLFLISTFRDLWETLHVNLFPESLKEAVR